jgi:glucose-6-phosphate isomerase
MLERAIEERVASRLFVQDPTIWGPDAEAEAGIRLAWTSLPTGSARLVPEILELRDELRARGLAHVVLCGMGGSSLAPEVICTAAGVDLTVLDSSHPDMVRRALDDRLAQSVVVVSSKSGSTVETDSLLRGYVAAFQTAGRNPADHLVIVTDPDSPFDKESTATGYRVFRADPHVGGRYSALSAFGLVPSGLAGADIATLLADAAEAAEASAQDSPDNPALQLGVRIGAAANEGVDKLVLFGPHGFGDWIEQLVAESTGKLGKGILPVVVPGPDAPNASPSTADSLVMPVDDGRLGAQLMIWEAAVAVAGWVIGINPFDQPDVESAKAAARDLLSGGGAETAAPDLAADGIAAYGTDANTLEAAVDAFLGELDPDAGYVAIQAYLDRLALPEYVELRELLARRTGRPVTFGWGPRFLHSTGQYHKGGPPTGIYLQLTDDPVEDLSVPGREFTFGSFIAAQAAGDAHVLRGHGRPVLRLHLTDSRAALTTLRGLLA